MPALLNRQSIHPDCCTASATPRSNDGKLRTSTSIACALAPPPVQALRKLLRRTNLAIGDPHLGVLLDQLCGQCSTDAGRPTGNECDFPRRA
jgi:hypothetical protein